MLDLTAVLFVSLSTFSQNGAGSGMETIFLTLGGAFGVAGAPSPHPQDTSDRIRLCDLVGGSQIGESALHHTSAVSGMVSLPSRRLRPHGHREEGIKHKLISFHGGHDENLGNATPGQVGNHRASSMGMGGSFGYTTADVQREHLK